MGKKVVILDYNLGNLFSVKHACDYVGIDSHISSSVEDVQSADALILPGVGAFPEAMKNLVELGLVDEIKAFADLGKPIFGICLGLQLLFTGSEEFENTPGLNLVHGTIKKFPNQNNGRHLKVPQINWNTVGFGEASWANTALNTIEPNSFMYFVHSYYVVPENKAEILTRTDYEGFSYCSSISKNNNIFAVQFHPEKSGEKGVEIYKNWALQHDLI